MDLVVVNDANGGLKARSQYIKESKLVEVSGLFHCDHVNLDRLILNGLPNSFVLMADNVSINCKVCIIEAQLCVRYVKWSDEKYKNIQQLLPATPACHPVKRVVMKTHSVVQGISSLN